MYVCVCVIETIFNTGVAGGYYFLQHDATSKVEVPTCSSEDLTPNVHTNADAAYHQLAIRLVH